MLSRLSLPIKRLAGSHVASSFQNPMEQKDVEPLPRSGVQAFYKVNSVPLFSKEQIESVKHNPRNALLDLYYPFRHQSSPTGPKTPTTAAADTASVEDLSDSLFHRVHDILTPGSTPYYVLPLLSPSLLHHLNQSTNSGGVQRAAERLNRYTARQKGVALFATSASDALQVHRLSEWGLVYVKHRVLCRLPPSIGEAAVRTLRRGEEELWTASRRNPTAFHLKRKPPLPGDPSSKLQGEEGDGVWVGEAVRLFNANHPKTGKVSRVEDILQAHPFVKGGLIDGRRQLLLHHGHIRCRVECRSGMEETKETPTVPSSAEKIHLLFQSRKPSPSAATSTTCTPTKLVESYPWLEETDHFHPVLDLQRGAKRYFSSENGPTGRLSGQEDVMFHFDLLAVSEKAPQEYYALYEVYGRPQHLTQEGISKVFQLCGAPVFNDYLNFHPLNVSLFNAIRDVRDYLKQLSPATLSRLPSNLQYDLRYRLDAEDFIAGPIESQSLDRTEAFYLSHVEPFGPPPPSPQNPSTEAPGEEEVEEKRELYREWKEKASRTVQSKRSHPRLKLLSESLLHVPEASAKLVAQLALGSGVELVSLSLPDITNEENRLLFHHMALRKQQQGVSRSPDGEEEMQENQSRLHYTTFSSETHCVPLYSTVLRSLHTRPSRQRGQAQLQSQDWVQADATPLESNENVPKIEGKLPDEADPKARTSNGVLFIAHHQLSSLSPTEAFVLLPADGSYRWLTSLDLPEEFHALREEWCQQQHGEGTVPLTGALPLFLLPEHCVPYKCHYCGGTGHTWQQCSEYWRRESENVLLSLEATPSTLPLSPSRTELTQSGDAGLTPSLEEARRALSRDDSADRNQADLLSTVVMATPASTKKALNRNHGRGIVSPYSDGSDVLIPVPNKAATMAYTNTFRLRAEQKKPSMHRRVMRCAYCSGKHHISQCPKLEQQG